MSDVPTPRRLRGSWLIATTAGIVTLLAVTLVVPAIEEVQREAARAQRKGKLNMIYLTATNPRPGDRGSVPDTPAADLGSLASFAHRDERPVPGLTADAPASRSSANSVAPAAPGDRWLHLRPPVPVREGVTAQLPPATLPEPARVVAVAVDAESLTGQPFPVNDAVPPPAAPPAPVSRPID
jgi:hypothetical protein